MHCRAGELQVRGDMVFVGYYKNSQATADTIRDGWLYTGDIVAEKNAQLKIVDRMMGIMITDGGKNLSPSEIENTLKASPYIKERIILADRRRYVAALVQLDFQTVGRWAEERQIPFTHYRFSGKRSGV
jgi:long-chain acyl-CoA synthetase